MTPQSGVPIDPRSLKSQRLQRAERPRREMIRPLRLRHHRISRHNCHGQRRSRARLRSLVSPAESRKRTSRTTRPHRTIQRRRPWTMTPRSRASQSRRFRRRDRTTLLPIRFIVDRFFIFGEYDYEETARETSVEEGTKETTKSCVQSSRDGE